MKGNLLIFVCFLGGIAVGRAGIAPDWLLEPSLPKLLLTVLVGGVGLGIGAGDDLHRMIRSLRLRMFALPLFTVAGTLLFSLAGVLLLPGRSLTECLAVGSGFGYYSLSSVLIADLGSASLGQAAADCPSCGDGLRSAGHSARHRAGSQRSAADRALLLTAAPRRPGGRKGSEKSKKCSL